MTDRSASHVYPKWDYKEYPKTLAEDDVWGQVRRTVHGKPVPEEQISLIVEAVRGGLQLTRDDVVLDLACGNGALSRYFFDDVNQLLGVDFSEYLVSVAMRLFLVPGKSDFVVQDAAGYVLNESEPERFTKVLCYGAFSYFTQADALAVLMGLYRRFPRVQRVLLGNLPDRDLAALYYPADKDYQAELDEPASQIGIWRSTEDLRHLAATAGWRMEVRRMPAAFYAAAYRYDAVLTRSA
jgi:cyclopropane fatty-acyl-phospholipid synthase-like methyltransferase